MLKRQDEEMLTLLRPIQKKLYRKKLVLRLAGSAIIGLGAGGLLLLLSRFLPIFYYKWAAGMFPVLALLAGLIWTMRQKPTLVAAAKEADRHGLAERTVTALENRAQTSTLAVRQREDAMARLRGVLPQVLEGIAVFRLSKIKWIGLSSAFLCWVLFFSWPNAMDQVLAQKLQEQQMMIEAKKKLDELEKSLASEKALSEEQKKKAAEIMAEAKRKLASAEDTADKLNALRAAEKQLEKWKQAQSARQQMLQQLAQGMSGVQGMKPEQAAELARQLQKEAEKWANQASAAELKELEKVMEQLKQAGAQNNPQAAEQLSKAMQEAMQQLAQSQQATQFAAQMMAALQQSQQMLAGAGASAAQAAGGANGMASTGTSGQAAVPAMTGQAGNATTAGQPGGQAGTPGQGGTPGQSGTAAQGTGNSPSGSQSNGNGQGSGQGQGNGNGQGAGQGNGNGNGQGSGSGNGSGAGLGNGNHELVSVPSERITTQGGPEETVGGPLGAGPSETRQSGNTQVSAGSARPYQEVYKQYAQFARESMEKGSIPGDYQDIVKDYFSNIEP